MLTVPLTSMIIIIIDFRSGGNLILMPLFCFLYMMTNEYQTRGCNKIDLQVWDIKPLKNWSNPDSDSRYNTLTQPKDEFELL